MGLQIGERTPVSLLGVVVQKLFDQFLGLFVVDELRKFELALHDLFVDIVGALCGVSEGQHPAQKLIETHPQRPEIHQIVIALAEDDIGRHVVGRSDDGEGLAHLVVFSADDLGGREVDQLHVPF